MILHTHTTDIDASPDAVWDALASFDGYARWNPYTPEASGRFALGETIRMTVLLDGRPMKVQQRISELDAGARTWAWVSASWYTVLATGGLRRFTVEARDDGGSRLVDHEEIDGPLASWVVGRYGPTMRAGMEATGAALKAFLEDGTLANLPAPPSVAGEGGLSPKEAVAIVHRLVTDPIGMIEDYKAEHGDLFTIPIPFGLTPPFTFLTTREGYTSVLSLDPSIGRNGPVIDRVPAMARWTPRSSYSDEHLQELLLLGRRFIGQRLRERKLSELEGDIVRAVDEGLAGWGDRVDLADDMVGLIHETSARLTLGDDLWAALGPDAPGWVRTIVNAVDAARAAAALSPAAKLLPEYAATRRLSARLLEIANDPRSDRFAYVRAAREITLDGRPLRAEDVAWVMFFGVWNATLYTGTYGVWSYLDLLTHPDDLAAVRDPSPERIDLLTGGVVETMRRNPISWQLRSLASPVRVTCDGAEYEVPAGHFLSVFSHGLNRDGDVYPDPMAWKPRRYLDGAPAPLLFGTGPFSCVAQRWVKWLLATIHAAVLDRVDLTLEGPLPSRISRVHLLYPSEPVWAAVRPRADRAAA